MNLKTEVATSYTTRLKVLALLILWATAFIPVYPGLFHAWINSPNNSHGILVPIISAFLIWKKRHELKEATLSTASLGAYILTGSMALYVLCYIGSVAVVCRAMIVFSLAGLVLFACGKEIFRLIKFPIFFLFFMIPIPDSVYGQVAFPLQLFATKVSTLLIRFLGISAYMEGNMVYFAQTQLEIAEACSGLRSMMAFVMLSFFFVYYMMDRERLWKRGVIVISAIPLALFANIVRITGTGILANFYGSKVARGFMHEFSGLAVFCFGFILLYFEYQILRKIQRKRTIMNHN